MCNLYGITNIRHTHTLYAELVNTKDDLLVVEQLEIKYSQVTHIMKEKHVNIIILTKHLLTMCKFMSQYIKRHSTRHSGREFKTFTVYVNRNTINEILRCKADSQISL